MSDSAYPSIGLKIDLPEIARGITELERLKRAYDAIGSTAAGVAANVSAAVAQRKTEARGVTATIQAASREEVAAVSAAVRAEGQLRAQAAVEAERTAQRVSAATIRNTREQQAAVKTAGVANDQASRQVIAHLRGEEIASRTSSASRLADVRIVATAQAAAGKAVITQLKAEEVAQRLKITADKEAARQAKIAAAEAAKATRAAQQQAAATQAQFASWARAQAAANAKTAPAGGGGGSGGGGFLGTGFGPSHPFIAGLTALRGGLTQVRRLFLDVRTAVAIFLGSMIVRPLIDMADAMTALTARIGFFAARASDVPYLMEAIYKTAQDSRTPLEAIATLYTRLAPLAERLGRSQSQILNVASIVAKGAQVGGATRAEATSSSQQLAQALASNRFGGDELRSVAENAPILLAEIAKQFKSKLNPALQMSSGEFIKWAQAGNASAEVVIGAIEGAGKHINEMFKRFPLTIGQSMTLVGNAFTHMVGLVNVATGASRNLSTEIAKFAAFLDSDRTVTMLANAIGFLGDAIKVTTDAVRVLLSYAPAIGAMFAAAAVTRVLAWAMALKTVRNAVIAYEAAAVIAGRATASWIAIQGLAGLAAGKFMAGLRGILALVGGPWGAAFIAAALVVNTLTNAYKTLSQASDMVKQSRQAATDADVRALAYAESLGDAGKDLTAALLAVATANDTVNGAAVGAAHGTDVAAEAARFRAQAEAEATAAIYDRIAADDLAMAKKLQQARFWGGVGNDILYGMAVAGGMDAADAAGMRDEMRAGRLAADNQISALLGGAGDAGNKAALIRANPISVTAPVPGSGTVQGAGAGTSDGQKAHKNLINSLAEEIDKSKAVQVQISAETRVRRENTTAIVAMYSDGLPSAQQYSDTLKAQAEQQLSLRLAEIAANTEAEYSKELAADRTPKVRALVDSLKEQRQAEERLRYEQERANTAADYTEEVAQRTANMVSYIAALNAGADALEEYNLQQEINNRIAQTKGAVDPATIRQDVQNEQMQQADAAWVEHLRLRKEEARYAGMSSRDAEIEKAAIEGASEYMKQMKEPSRAVAENAVRTRLEYERAVDELAKMKQVIKDSIEQGFVETGKLDLKALRDNLTRHIRQAVYDALLAKPIEIIVDARVKQVDEGIRGIIDQVKSAWRGDDTRLSGFFKGVKDIGKMIADKIPEGLKSAFKKAGDLFNKSNGAASVGSTIAEMLGFEGNKNKVGQAIADSVAGAVGFALGGPVGAAIAAAGSHIIGTLINSRKRPNAIAQIGMQNGQFTVGQQWSADGGPMADISALASAIATGLNNAATAFGVDTRKLQNYSTTVGYVTGDRNFFGLGGEGFYGGAINPGSTDYGSFQANALQRGVDFSQITDSNKLAEEIVRQMLLDAIDAGAVDINAAGRRLIESADNLDEAAAIIKNARELKGNLSLQLLGYTDPKNAALIALRQQQVDRRNQIGQLYSSGLVTPGSLDSVLGQLETAEIRDTLSQFANAVDGATASLKDMEDAYKAIADYAAGLALGPLSPYAPQQQLSIAATNYSDILSQAQAGSYSGLQGLPDAAQAYLERAQQFYGSSTQYAAIFEAVQSALDGLDSQVAQDPLQAAVEQQTALLQEAIANQTVDIVAAIQALQNTTAASAELVANTNTDGLGAIADTIGDTAVYQALQDGGIAA